MIDYKPVMPLLIPPRSKILFTGDSITDCGRRGDGFPLGNGYVRMTADLLLARYPEHRLEFINTGIGGNNIRDLVDRWTDDVIRHQPDWLSIMIGINDCNGWVIQQPGRNVSPEEYADCYEKILSRIKAETGAKIVLINPFLMSIDNGSEGYRHRLLAALPEFQRAVRELAARHETLYVDFHAMFQRLLVHWPTDRFGLEAIHPNATGHLIMTHEWLQSVDF